jgi:hypothetical protein
MHSVRAIRDQELSNVEYRPESRDLPGTLAITFTDNADKEPKTFEAKLSVSMHDVLQVSPAPSFSVSIFSTAC